MKNEIEIEIEIEIERVDRMEKNRLWLSVFTVLICNALECVASITV